jgi:phospholipase C
VKSACLNQRCPGIEHPPAKSVARTVISTLLMIACAGSARAQIRTFQHIVVIIQENRTPDNLFQGLCVALDSCSAYPAPFQYDIQTRNWRDRSHAGGLIQPLSVPLASSYDLDHSHPAFVAQCDLIAGTRTCAMDGAAKVTCTGTCLAQPQFRYVDNSTGILNPYLELASSYGWANYMFQTNQGPSLPAHQFLFGGTSAPSAQDDASGIFAAENGTGQGGCIAAAGTTIALVSPPDIENQHIYPCFEHDTLPDILPPNVSWKYYAPNAISIWTAPDAIRHICQPNLPTGGTCVGPEWVQHVDLKSPDVLSDISKCALPNLSWVIPAGQNSDHPLINTGGGPDWVASIVDAIGASACRSANGATYWETTAILIVWDDWGGWYDHEPPQILPQPEGDYQYGFRVPFIFVSAYTPAGLIENSRHDFGSILRFIEHNFGVRQGALNFADARAKDSLSGFFNQRLAPRPFATIGTARSAEFFINDSTPPTDPDDD